MAAKSFSAAQLLTLRYERVFYKAWFYIGHHERHYILKDRKVNRAYGRIRRVNRTYDKMRIRAEYQ